MIASSSQPPARAAAARPSGTPRPSPIATATSATASEVRAPAMIMDAMSRPRWSVPSGWASDGPWSLSAMARAATS